jgi:hypothetical protein
MNPNKTLYRVSILTGSLLVIAALSNILNLNNIFIAINTGDISKHFASSILIDVAFSGVLLLLLGTWLLFLSGELRALRRKARQQGIVVGLALIIFGGGFWFKFPRSLQLPFFLLIGLLLLLPLLIFYRKFKN